MSALLPPGCSAAALHDEDVDAVARLVRRCEEHDSGVALFERADLVADLATADREHDGVLVRAPDGALLAWALLVERRTRMADVAPEARGRGIGSWLVRWSLARGRQLGADRVGQTVEDHRLDAIRLFGRFGAQAVRTSWILERPVDVGVPAAPAPAGLVLRASTPADQAQALTVLEAAFGEWPDRPPSSPEVWRALVTQREGFTDEQLQVVVGADANGAPRIVAAASLLLDDSGQAWVDKLGVDPRVQGRGVGAALLARTFAVAREHGCSRVALSTDSQTGALAFYERLGMAVTRSFTHWAVPLAGPR